MRASVDEAGALLARSDSAGRRRQSTSPVQSAWPSPPGARGGLLRRQSSSFREDVGHAASETYLVSRLTFSLLRYLGYNIHNLVDHFNERGLHRSLFLSIMEGEESLSRYSPEIIAKKSSAETIALLPLIVLMHGTTDYSIPSYASQTFVDVLQKAGAEARLLLYEGKTHTDIFLQDPLRGGRDPLVEDILSIIHADDAIARQKIALAPIPSRLVCEWQLKLARRVSPF